jgi:hypothetical protein
VVKIEAVSIDVFHGELAQTPRFLFERLDDICAAGMQFLIGRIDVRRKYPANSRFEWPASSAKENHHGFARDGTDIAPWVQSANLEAECITVMLLSALHIFNRKLRHGWGKRGLRLLLICGGPFVRQR